MNEGKHVDASSVFETPPVRRHESIEMRLAKFVHAGSSFVSEMVEPDHRGRIVEGDRGASMIATTVTSTETHATTVRKSNGNFVDFDPPTCTDPRPRQVVTSLSRPAPRCGPAYPRRSMGS